MTRCGGAEIALKNQYFVQELQTSVCCCFWSTSSVAILAPSACSPDSDERQDNQWDELAILSLFKHIIALFMTA